MTGSVHENRAEKTRAGMNNIEQEVPWSTEVEPAVDVGSGQFFYAIGGKQYGPVSFKALREMAIRDELKRKDKIWRKGMSSWKRADAVHELFQDLPPDLEPKDAPPRQGEISSPRLSNNRTSTTAEEPVARSRSAISPVSPRKLIKSANDGIDRIIAFLTSSGGTDSANVWTETAVCSTTRSTGLGEARSKAHEQRATNCDVHTGQVAKKCDYCGRENAADAVHCRDCGGTNLVIIPRLAEPQS